MATHGSLIGDSRAGAAEYRRFLPTLFTVDGRALDEKGEVCQELACPRCHAIVNRGLLEMEPLFLSILGAPSSGKSFYLATMIHSVGTILSKQFHLRFENAAPRTNQLMTEYVKTLFDYEDHTKLVKLEKTDRTGKWYYETHVGEQDLLMSRPYLYSVQPDETHPLHSRRREVSRMVCLYDNAGEHFLPGAVTSQTPVIDHMAKSEALLFIYDPTQESAFRRACRACRDASLDPQLESAATTYPQADVLSEAAARVRQLTSMPVTEKFDRPLIVIVHKFDAWRPLLKKSPKALDDVIRAGHDGVSCLQLDVLMEVSRDIEELLMEHGPSIVTAARGFASEVVFIPVTATGRSPVVAGSDSNGRVDLRLIPVRLLLAGLNCRYSMPCTEPACETATPPSFLLRHRLLRQFHCPRKTTADRSGDRESGNRVYFGTSWSANRQHGVLHSAEHARHARKSGPVARATDRLLACV